MSFDKRESQAWSPFSGGSAATATGASAPGKRTQVELMPAHAGGATGFGGRALGAADTDASHGAPAHAERDHQFAADDEAAAPGSMQPGEIMCQAGGEAEAGGAGGGDHEAGASEDAVEESEHHGATGAGDLHGGPASTPASGPATGPAATGAGAAPAAVKPKFDSHTIRHAARGADTRTTVGVGEEVKLTGNVAGTWSANHGTIAPPSGLAARWTAPATAGTTTIKLTSGGKSVSKKFKVIAPTGLTMKKASEDAFPAGQQGAGMITNVTVGPTSVSFGNVEWLEVPGPASSISGYFKKYSGLPHHPNPNWLQWNDANTGLTDHASLFRWPAPWSVGGFQWAIPNKWRVASVGGAGHVFTTTHQVFKMTNKKGTTTITKGGASVTRTP